MATSNIPTAAAAPSPADPAPAAPAPAPTQNSVDSPAAAGGRRFGSIIRLRPECVEEYKRYHADAWPAVAQQIRECNIRECPSLAPPPPLPFSCCLPPSSPEKDRNAQAERSRFAVVRVNGKQT